MIRVRGPLPSFWTLLQAAPAGDPPRNRETLKDPLKIAGSPTPRP